MYDKAVTVDCKPTSLVMGPATKNKNMYIDRDLFRERRVESVVRKLFLLGPHWFNAFYW